MGLTKWYSWRGALCRRALASQRNVEGGLHRMIFSFPLAGFPLWFFIPSSTYGRLG